MRQATLLDGDNIKYDARYHGYEIDRTVNVEESCHDGGTDDINDIKDELTV